MIHFWVSTLLSTLFLTASFSSVFSQAGDVLPVKRTDLEAVALDRDQLERIEDLSESLANNLHNFSIAVKDRNISKMRGYFSDRVVASYLPAPPFATDQRLKWITYREYSEEELSTGSSNLDKLIESWAEFLNGFDQIEDVRFKVQDAEFAERQERVEAQASIKYFLIGRDNRGLRLWVKGTGRILAHQSAPDSWSMSEMALDRMEVLRSEVDLFTEVSQPAGVLHSLPAYGEPGNDDFIYRGAAAGDINGNGLIDLVVTGIGKVFLFLNQGDGTFKDVADEVGLPPIPTATAPLLVDYDNDGDVDIFLAAVGDQLLFQNRLKEDGVLNFIDVSLEAGVALPAHGFSVTAGDITSNGFPDLYVTSYNSFGRIMPNSWHRATNGTANLLLVNQGDGTFKESAAQWGVRDTRWSYAAQFADLTGNGRLDLYVANDFGENALFVHMGDRFEDRADQLGVLDPGNGMGVAIGDYNNDGILDLYVTNMSSTAGNRILNRIYPGMGADENLLRKLAAGNTLFQGLPDGSFKDVTLEKGPFVANWAWGGLFFDFDNDGWPDLYNSNGFVTGRTMKDT